MGLIKITADMTESERTAVINTNMQYLQLSNRLRKYPIGMIVGFATDIDPNELYGGTWERIKGRVIWGIDDGETAGCTGGTKEETLTTAQIPAHVHKVNSEAIFYTTIHGNLAGPAGSSLAGASQFTSDDYPTTQSTGGGQPHNNMMPYYGAYVWRKTGHGIGEDPTLTEYEAFVQQMNTAISEALSKERLITNATCANALRGSASGAAVSLTNVSPNEHTLGVKVSSKNLFTPNAIPVVPSNMGVTCTYDSTDNTFTLNGTLAANGNINLATLNIPLDDYYIARYYVSGDITVPEGVAYKTLFAMFVYGASSQFLDRLSQRIDNYNTPIIAAEAKNIYSISSANKWTFYLQNFGIGTVFNNYKFKIAVIKKDMYYTDIPYVPNVSDFSTVNVTRCGKNLIPPIDNVPYYFGSISGGKPFVASKNNTLSSLTDINVSTYRGAYTVKKLEEKTYTLTLNGLVNNCATKALFLTVGFRSSEDAIFGTTDIGSYKISSSNATSLTFTVPSGKPYCLIGFYNYPTAAGDTISLNAMQLELGTTATEYEPYTIAEYTPAADGTVSGVKSLYPTTTLITDTVGTIIEAEYSKDINKAFAELHQAIISLGGNV